MEMIKSRTLTSHTYNEEVARLIAGDVSQKYFPEFEQLHARLQSLLDASA